MKLNTVVYGNSSNKFDIVQGHSGTFPPFTAIQTVVSYKSNLEQEADITMHALITLNSWL